MSVASHEQLECRLPPARQQEDREVQWRPGSVLVSTVMPENSIDVLVVGAYAPELALIAHAAGADQAAQREGTASFTGTLHGLTLAGYAVGVGIPAAAIGMTRCLHEFRPRMAIAVGTCGAYDGRGIELEDVVCARRVQLVSTAAALGRGAMPAIMRAVCVPQALSASGFGRLALREVDVATTLALTTDDELAAQVGARSGCDVEHLEAFSIAAACEAFAVPSAIVLGVANRVGRSGRQEWQAHRARAETNASRTVLDWLERWAAQERG
jgi:nucleoside phosphorylase